MHWIAEVADMYQACFLGSRAVAGARGRAIVLNLPGRPKGAQECFRFVAPALGHLVALRQGAVPDASHGPDAP